MRILAIDIGTGTQDILLFDSTKDIENCIKMVMPSPTVIASERIKTATKSRMPLVLTGVNMGGGPVTESARNHIESGLKVYATIDAATTFDDDMEMVKDMGVSLISSDEIMSLPGVRHVELKDLDLQMITRSLASFEILSNWDALAVAVFDHGNAPPGYSDRKFRFDHLKSQASMGKMTPTAMSYFNHEIPEYMTRMLAVASCTTPEVPTLVMGTAEAAVLGSLEDRTVSSKESKIVVNLGNEHTLAFKLHGNTIKGLFEHHTHSLSPKRLESYIEKLTRGELDNDEIWNDNGHGALILEPGYTSCFLSVTGPMRHILEGSYLNPYFATPHGDMMLTGSFGLIRAWASKHELWKEEIEQVLDRAGG